MSNRSVVAIVAPFGTAVGIFIGGNIELHLGILIGTWGGLALLAFLDWICGSDKEITE